MEKLTNKEFWILWKHRNGKPFDLSMDKAYYLLEYGYLALSAEPSSDVDKYQMRFKVCVSRDGVHAAEHHHDAYFANFWTSVRSWIAIVLSAISTTITFLRFFIFD